MDSINDFITTLTDDMAMLGGQNYPGVLTKYLPNCKVRRSGCSSIENTIEFAECLEENRTTPTDWGRGPTANDPPPIQDNLKPCS
jgi:hypothetical protein